MKSLSRNVFAVIAALSLGCTGTGDSASRNARHPGETPVTPVTDAGATVPTTDAGVTSPGADVGVITPVPVDGSVAADVPTGISPTPVPEIPGHENLPVDNSRKEGPRLLSGETLIRSYLSLFGGLAPLEMQTRLRGTTPTGQNALFDTWIDYLSALGMPDYGLDTPRFDQTNPLMLAAFERIGVALCDRAVTSDLRNTDTAQRVVFRFALTTAAPSDTELDQRIGVLHRRFLAYPLAMAPDGRAARFRQLYRGTVARAATRPGMNPTEAAWATVCYAFVRHPEFHVY
jgi:hypothetical protein